MSAPAPALLGCETLILQLIFEDGEAILPRRGRLVAFSSGPENGHRVARVERGARTALALWFTCVQPE